MCVYLSFPRSLCSMWRDKHPLPSQRIESYVRMVRRIEELSLIAAAWCHCLRIQPASVTTTFRACCDMIVLWPRKSSACNARENHVINSMSILWSWSKSFANMSFFTVQVLQEKLSRLTLSQDSIETLSLWIIHHKAHASTSIEVWMEDMQSGIKAKLTWCTHNCFVYIKTLVTNKVNYYWKWNGCLDIC